MEGYSSCCEATSVDAVHAWLAEGVRIHGKQLIIVDIRGHVTYQKLHIKSSFNLRLSTLLMRRVFRGTAAVENVCSGTIKMDIERRKQSDVYVVLCDESSTKQNIHKDVHLYAQMLQPSTANPILHIDGGFEEFCRRCCHFCEGTVVTASPCTPKKKPSLSFPLGQHKSAVRPTGHCNTQSYQEEIRSRPPSEVLPFLYIGNAENASNESLLKKLGVTAVLNVSSNTLKYFESSFEYKQICVLDNHHADLLSQLNSAIEFIDSVRQKGGCTFVHCMAGISRSATVCIAYLMKHLCWELQIAFDFLKTKRSCVAPNLSFMGQLLVFQQQLQFNHQSLLNLKNGTSGKSTPPVPEETTNTPKSDTHLKFNVEDRIVAQSPIKPSQNSVDFCCPGNSMCSLEARKSGLKLLPLTKGNCISVPNTC